MSAKVYVATQANTEYVELGLVWGDAGRQEQKRTPLLFLKKSETMDLIRDLGKAVRVLEAAQ